MSEIPGTDARRTVRICLLPLRIRLRQRQANLQHFEERFREIADLRPDVVCLPECAFTGYLYEDEDLQRFAETIPGNTTETLSRIAAGSRCYICAGLLEKSAKGIFSAAVLVDPSGQIVLEHRKLIEQQPFVTGDRAYTTCTPWGRTAILICGDLFHSSTAAMFREPPDVVFVPMARAFDGKSPDLDRWVKTERQAYVDAVKTVGAAACLVNILDDTPEEGYFGGAMIVDALGHVLAESPHGTDEALLFDLAVPRRPHSPSHVHRRDAR